MNPPFQLNQTEKNMPYVLFYDREAAFVPNHWHKEIELVYAVKGGTFMAINNHIYELRQGDIAVVMSGDAHFYFRSEQHERMVVMFGLEIVEGCLPPQQKRELRRSLKNAARLSSQWRQEHADSIRGILDALAGAPEGETFGRELAIRAGLFNLVLCLARDISRDERQSLSLEASNQTKLLSHLERVFQFVEENYRQEIDLTTAAAALGFTASYFARFFKKYTNTTFMRYLTDYRITKAQGMLANENLSITQIAERSGFGSIKTFNRVFRETVGSSPSQYKKSIIEGNQA